MHYEETPMNTWDIRASYECISSSNVCQTRGVRIGLFTIWKQVCFDWNPILKMESWGMCFEIDLLKSESSTASNMHGRGSQALSCSNLFPLINSRRSTGCHPLGWALAPHTTRPRSHGYGSLWGPSSNLSSVTPGACRSHHYNRSRSMHLADAFIQSNL